VFVIGTAGHVDHGKSTLIHALTGINPDRLAEEQARQMTIDLGFAWLTLPSGREVSIVDVPGHEDFVKNMLAGIGGIDVALLVVAADEAVMPQTREHLAILDLLEIPRGLVALTKSDLIEDPEWLELVAEEVREELQGTVLEQARIVPVSATKGAGLSELVTELDRLLSSAEPRRDVGRPRLPIDRVFTMSGFGTVVTGTLSDGRFRVGDEVQIEPGHLSARIRGLQSHRHKLDEAEPGTRVAINLSGVAGDALERGQVVARPGAFTPTLLVDARLRLLKSAPWALEHNAEVDFYSGAMRAQAHVRLLDADALEPGQSGWVQFRLANPAVVARGDGYVIRSASPSYTLGGGRIVRPTPQRRHRRFRQEVLAQLEALLGGAPEDVLLGVLGQEILEARELVGRSGLPTQGASEALSALLANGQLVPLQDGALPLETLPQSTLPVVSAETWRAMVDEMLISVRAYHERYPLRAGMPREELKSRLRVPDRFFNRVLDRAGRDGYVLVSATIVRSPAHRIVLSAEQEQAVEKVLHLFRENPFSPPPLSQAESELGAELMQALIEDGRLVKVSDDVLFDAEAHAQMEKRLVAHLREHGSVTVAQVRDLFGTSRRYALGLLEDLDGRRVTKRMGDVRVLR